MMCMVLFCIFATKRRNMDIDEKMLEEYYRAVENGAEVMIYMVKDGKRIPLMDQPLKKSDFK